MSVKAVLRSGVQKWLSYRYTKIYHDLYHTMVSKSPELGNKAEGEEAWLDKWQRYDRNLSPLAYRIFSRFIGKDLNIMPMELCMCLVEPILNPAEFLHYYSDKNSFGKILQGIKMLLVTDKTDEADLQLCTIQIAFERRYIDLDEAVVVDIHERRRIFAYGSRDGRHINTGLRSNLLWRKRTDVRRRKTDRVPHSFAMYHLAEDGIRTA